MIAEGGCVPSDLREYARETLSRRTVISTQLENAK
jgi:hypothetical protein